MSLFLLCSCNKTIPPEQSKQLPSINASWTQESHISKICIHEPEIDFFMYHYIRSHDIHDAESTRDLSVDPRDFRTHMQYISDISKDRKITLMNGIDFIESLESGCFPWKRIWIFSSDDGWSDTYENLFPIAREYQIPFFFWIIGNKIDVPGFISNKEIIEISRNPLFTIASHSMQHEDQDKMTETQEKIEMCESKKIIESLIRLPVLSYVYPAGRMSIHSKDIAKECGYKIAWSTQYGTKWNPKNPSRYDINRIRIHNTTTIDLFKRTLEWNKVQ